MGALKTNNLATCHASCPLEWDLSNGMGQWTSDLSRVRRLLFYVRAAGVFRTWIPSLYAYSTASTSRGGPAPWRGDARPPK